MKLICENCVIRPWGPSDVPAIVHHANNRRVSAMLRDTFPFPYTVQDAIAWVSVAAAMQPRTDFAIEVDGMAAGGLGFTLGTDIQRYSAEIGYWLGESHWGRGIATEAVRAFSEYLFRNYHLLRLYALPFADNHASLRVLEKAGYRCEGQLVACAVKNGRPRDQTMYARINPDWSYPGD